MNIMIKVYKKEDFIYSFIGTPDIYSMEYLY